jgi:hypothetical protein
MEQALGRRLATREHVHHLNGDKTDNRLCNLEVLEKSAHHRKHVAPSYDIALAKSLYDRGVGYRKLSERFGVCRHTIREAFVARGWHRAGRRRASARSGAFQAV